uniref:Phlebovirus glycoprotein G2 fusion domain-containing protein n=1 Tax=Onchocerca volvulus TaxID=6282 RepID=A0A8R1TZ06_ONCVO
MSDISFIILLYHIGYSNLVTGTCPVIAEYQQQQQQQYENCSYSSASTLHAFRLTIRRQQATAVKDVACQCDSETDSDNDSSSGSSDTCGCSSDNGLFPRNPSFVLPVKIGALRKRQMGTFHSTLSCMKLLNDLESENTPLFAGTCCDSSLSSLTQSIGQKRLECSICRNHDPVTFAGTTDITSLPVITTTVVNTDTIEQHESKSAFTSIVNNIPSRKMTLASCYDANVVRVRRLMLSRSASDSKLCIRIGPQPKLGLVDIQSCDTRCKDVDELNRVTADIAAENPDMIRFQQVLNSWVSLFS